MCLPEATVRPCNECPWRVDSAPGWLGPYDEDEWVMLAHSDEPIACHITIEEEGEWETGNIRQCAGAGQYRRNIAKRPRNPEVYVADDRDDVNVFATPMAFTQHHGA